MLTLKKKKAKNIKLTTASVLDNSVVISAANAMEPLVWKTELKKITTASFEVKKSEDNFFSIVLKTKSATGETIAKYETSEDALDALMAISEALKSPTPETNRSHPQAKTADTTQKNSSTSKTEERKNFKLSIILLSTTLIFA